MLRFCRAIALFIIISLVITLLACTGTPDTDKERDTSKLIPQSDSETETETETEQESEVETPHESDSVIVYPELTLPEAVDALIPSIVKLYCYDYDGNEVTSHGSGFFIDESGTFITNAHVVKNAYTVKARVHTGEYYDVDAIYSYSQNTSDHAICSISGYSSVPVEFDSEATLGEKVYALGYPGSTFRFYSSEGEVVNTEQTVGSITYVENTAVIYDGNSGGILANEDGKVLGIATGSLRGGEYLAVTYSEFEADLSKRDNPQKILDRFHPTMDIALTEHNAPTFFKISTVAETTNNPPMITLSLRKEYVDGDSIIDLASESATITVSLIGENDEAVGDPLEFVFTSRKEMIDGVTISLDSSVLPKGSYSLSMVSGMGTITRID